MFTLPWTDKSFVDVFASQAPDPELLHQLVHLVRALLEELVGYQGTQSAVGEDGAPASLRALSG
ncbi:hypothetical protein [Streptomyces sp. H27-C3]|uniref:hypothetical protein n=1 Tax=Streptomyces sp. H27-C3 TaxID=3046305 RepID=UPI0024BB1019|nr:hypothetical protein [Streptomyces sp. H27-C3]MDJ0463364.1 hypothetical protein [Streptomyces sp. H27-C3]